MNGYYETRHTRRTSRVAQPNNRSGRRNIPVRRDHRRTSRDRQIVLVRFVLVVMLIVFTWAVLRSNDYRSVDFQVISAAMSVQPSISGLVRGDANDFRIRLGVDPDGCEGWLIYGGESSMDVQEIMIAKSSDSGTLDTLESACRSRIESQLEVFRDYGTNQAALLDNAILWQKGEYLFYGVSEDVDRWEAAFLSCIH